MKGKIVFLTGGARSGKSSFALNEASKINGQKAYIATAEALDDEMRERIEKHKKDRSQEWDTYEEPVNISSVLSEIREKYSTVILDCLTLWLSNIMLQSKQDTEKSIREFIEELETFKKSSIVNRQPSTRAQAEGSSIIIVSNEVGMGVVPDNELAREFRDLAGLLNQRVAEIADEVYLVTAGIPLKIKSST